MFGTILIETTSDSFHLAHGGCLHRAPLSCLGIDGYSMGLPRFHIAHGGLLRPIDFARGYSVLLITPI